MAQYRLNVHNLKPGDTVWYKLRISDDNKYVIQTPQRHGVYLQYTKTGAIYYSEYKKIEPVPGTKAKDKRQKQEYERLWV